MKNSTKFTKIILLLCIALLTSSILLSCGDKNPDSVNDNSIKQSDIDANDDLNATGTTSDPRFDIKEDIPELDFNQEKFTILYPTWSMYNDYYFAEDEIGEKLNDAIYTRQKDVEQRFNVIIEPVTKGYIYDVVPALSKSVKSGSDDYSLVLTHCITGIAEITAGLALDWNTVPYVDFTKPWWNQKMNEEMSVENVLLTAVSDFIIFDPNVIYFNKQMAQDYALGDLYATVRDGKWTWDKLSEMAKLVSKDLDGDGQYDEADQYGFVTHVGWMMESALQSCNVFTTKKNDDGTRTTNTNSEKFGRIVNILHDLFYVGSQTYLGTWDPNNPADTYESQVSMGSNRALFHVDPLSAGKRYRAYDVEFGILPFPKYDEAQKDYLSLSWNGFMVLPITVDPGFAGAICEALAAESYRYVVPAYYDVLLTSKVARDEESGEMIDIIYKGACYDFGLNYGGYQALSFPISNILATKSPEYVSYVEKNENLFNKQMQKIYDTVVKNYINN